MGRGQSLPDALNASIMIFPATNHQTNYGCRESGMMASGARVVLGWRMGGGAAQPVVLHRSRSEARRPPLTVPAHSLAGRAWG